MPPTDWGTDELLRFSSEGGAQQPRHVHDCTFGPGFFRVLYTDGGITQTRYFEEKAQADTFIRLLPPSVRRTVKAHRDECLDKQRHAANDAMTPDVVDAEWWLKLPKDQAIAELGLSNEREYARVAKAIESVLALRDNRQAQGGVRAPIVIKRRQANRVAPDLPNNVTRIRLTGHIPRHMLPVYGA